MEQQIGDERQHFRVKTNADQIPPRRTKILVERVEIVMILVTPKRKRAKVEGDRETKKRPAK